MKKPRSGQVWRPVIWRRGCLEDLHLCLEYSEIRVNEAGCMAAKLTSPPFSVIMLPSALSLKPIMCTCFWKHAINSPGNMKYTNAQVLCHSVEWESSQWKRNQELQLWTEGEFATMYWRLVSPAGWGEGKRWSCWLRNKTISAGMKLLLEMAHLGHHKTTAAGNWIVSTDANWLQAVFKALVVMSWKNGITLGLDLSVKYVSQNPYTFLWA